MAQGIRIFEQRISVGGNFDGTVPPGDIVRGNDLDAWPAAAVGGLFKFEDFDYTDPVWIRSFEIHLDGQSSWTVHKKDLAGTELLLFTGTTDTSFITTQEDSFLFSQKQELVVRTVGATGLLVCRVHLQNPG